MTNPDDYDRDQDEEPEPDEDDEPDDGPDAEENEDYPVVTGDEEPPPLEAYDLPRPRLPDSVGEEEGGS